MREAKFNSESIWAGYDLAKITSYDLSALIKKISQENMRVLIYGAGVQARYAISALNSNGINVNFLCDSSEQKHGKTFCGHKILNIMDIVSYLDENLCVFIGSCYPIQILSMLEKFNIKNVFSCMPLFEQFDFSSINNEGLSKPKTINDINREIYLYDIEFENFVSKFKSKELKLKSLDVIITEKCSLRCVNCSNLMQYFSEPKNSEISLLLASMDKIMNSVDWIFELRVLGGEPFVNKEMYKVIDRLLFYKNFGKLIIYTNGTLLPKGRNLSCLKSQKIIVDISNYGKLSRKHDQLITLLEQQGIQFASKEPVWTDSGRLLPYQDRTEKQNAEIFFNCCTNDVLTLLHGNLYHCPFSASADILHAIPHDSSDVIAIGNEVPGSILRQKIDFFYKKKSCLTACSYCNGRDFNTKIIKAAIQSKKILPLLRHY